MTSSSKLEFVTLDVFTAKPYEGNPLAIVRIPNGHILSQDQKQTVAREFNLSETTFLHEKTTATEDDEWTVDIFMTTKELPFAGHPTVGTACYVLGRTARERGIESGTMNAQFNLKAGKVDLEYDVAKMTVKAAIPHDVHVHKKRCSKNEILAWQPQLAEAYQQGKTQAHNDFPVVSIVKGMTFVLVELENEEALSMVSLAGQALVVDGLNPDWCDVLTGTYFFVRTGKGEDGTIRLRTRMIEGALEDPATGSAASDLAAYLSLTEGGSSETLRYEITQGVEMGRRSEILIEIDLTQDRNISKLYLKGGAVEVMEGRLTI
ncbi:epimerase PhzC PhzF [Pyrenophora tritici-repentis]|nr:Diaminopimelate epimerase-like protein [Pyrenophora tritici-repentis]KAF7455112.1 Diaminopimelate epimerase protein [Pyrenophora tritici-repentis]KAG9388868.1 Diaminopimelate epimerase protein [Pyrenophora tritici-repentis]KAI1518025.1 Diaminopimelate epimerase protein [Pyrenophora tritici-repentis]KAI1533058.1 epimerase PhzC PhzF [Pyrenophora tritici-repentis]